MANHAARSAGNGERNSMTTPNSTDSTATPIVANSGAASQVTPNRFEGLDAYRGIAALLIVIFHAYQYSRVDTPLYVYEGTWLHPLLVNLDGTVAWFFVLSGFLVFLPFVRAAVKQTASESARGFLIRRAIRILPLYYVAILIVWTFRYTGGLDQWIDLFEHLTFTNVFDPAHIFWTIGPAWSLAVEIIFYIIVVILGILIYRLSTRIASENARIGLVAGVISFLFVASVVYKWWAFSIAQFPAENWPIYFGPMAKLDTFALGMLLAVLVASGQVRLGRNAIWLLRITGILLLGLTFVFRKSDPLVDLYFHTLCGIAFFLVLASTVFAPESGWSKMLARPVFQFLGLISYSLYLWHEPIMIELGKRNWLIQEIPSAFPVNALVLITISTIVAALSYWLIESPVMNLRYLFTREGRLTKRYADYESEESKI
jgi:peptidoglycan/LPS O-acetylase OafA/YrhL